MKFISVKRPKFFRGLLSHYRMVFINEKSLEEVATFRLSKGSVYGMLSTIFLVVAVLTIAVVVYSPVKYYIPGYGSAEDRRALLELRRELDSLSDQIAARDAQMAVVKQLVAGEEPLPRDTTPLTDAEVQKALQTPTILPRPEDIQNEAKDLPKAKPE